MGTCSSLRRRMMMGAKAAQKIEIIKPSRIANTYITTSGAEAAYTGWSSTDYIDITGFKFAYFINLNQYWSLYDQSKSPIGRVYVVDGKFHIPSNAHYLRYSGLSGTIAKSTLILSTLELFPTTLPVDSNNRYVDANGKIVSYNGWNTYRLSQLEGYQGAFQTGQPYNASYDADGKPVLVYYSYLPNEENISYMVFSSNQTTYKVYLIPNI